MSSGMFPTEQHDFAQLARDWKGIKPRFDAAKSQLNSQAAAGDAASWGDVMGKYRTHEGYRGRVFDQIPQGNLFAQEKIPVISHAPAVAEKMRARGAGTTREYRVHMVGGEPVEGLSVPRFPTHNPIDILREKSKANDAATWLRGQISKLPEAHSGIPYNVDVAPIEGGGYKIIEMNPGNASGIIPKTPFGGQHMYKHMTGRYTPEMAALRGLGLGAVGAGATAGGMALHRHLSED
jgi:hypothetical protein